MTASHFTTTLLCIIVAWSAWKTFRHLSPEEGEREKVIKAYNIGTTQTAHIYLILAVLVVLFHIPGLWPIIIAVTLYSQFQNYRLNNKRKLLIDEIYALHRCESIVCIHLRTYDHTAEGGPIKIWFKRGTESWPLVELIIGVGFVSAPIEKIQSQILRKNILPRIQDILQRENNNELFYSIKKDLLEHGVSHPIDIKGWNSNPIIQEMIERIMNANPPQQNHPEEPSIKAA